MATAGLAPAPAEAFDLQGHRGARGLAPENTLAGFRVALGLGVSTLETDLAATRDDVLVLSHDPQLNPDLTRGPDGRWLGGPGPAIRSLAAAELAGYDIGRLNPGSRYGRQYPEQRPVDGERFPTLAQLLALAGPPVRFNVEIKTDPGKPGLTAPPERFAQLAAEAVRRAGAGPRTTVQSFDWRGLLALKQFDPSLATGCLTIESNNFDTVGRASGRPSPWLGGLDLGRHGGSLPRLAQAAGCAVWSPFWRNLTAETLREARSLGLRVIPWTVNDQADMARMVELGVDGLITDYPDRARAVLGARGIAVK